MQHGLGFQHPATVGDRVRREAAQILACLRDQLVAQPLGGRGAQQHRVDLHRLPGGEVGLRTDHDGRAFAFQPAGELGDCVLVGLLDLRLWIVQQDADAVLLQALPARPRQRQPPCPRGRAVGPGQKAKGQLQVRRRPGQGADDSDVGGGKVSRQRLAAVRDDLPGRLVAEDPAVVRRVADRGADIRAGVQPCQPRGERRPRSAGGAAGRAGQVPRIVAGAVDRVEALPVRQHERDIRLAEDHSAGAAVLLDHGRVRVCDVVAVFRNAPGRGRTRQVVAFLHGYRQAVQGAGVLPCRAASVRSIGFRPRAVGVLPDDCVDRRIVPLDAVKKVIEQFPRAYLPRIEQRYQLGGRFVVDFGHHALPVCYSARPFDRLDCSNVNGLACRSASNSHGEQQFAAKSA